MLKFDHVYASYNKSLVLKDINVTFEKNKITTIIGPNGCGKSTLLQCVNNQVTISKGNIYFRGISLKDIDIKEKAKSIALLPQIRSISSITAKSLVEHGRFPYLGFFRKPTEEDKKIVDKSMEFTNTYDFRHTNIEELSGGERQRVFFAMTLAQGSELILLDEPTTYLDIYYQYEVLNLIKRLKNQGKTIILVLHDIAQAIAISDSIVLMNEGRVIAHDKPENLVSNHLIEDIFKVKCKILKDGNESHFIFTP